MVDSSSLMEKIALLDKVVILHPDLIRALDGIKDCVNKTGFYRESVNCTLLGTGGTGKSTASRIILSQMPSFVRDENLCERTVVPVFYAEVPSPVTVKSLAETLLRKLNDPNPSAGTTVSMTRRLCRLLAQCETKLVLLDEFHHLLSLRKTNARLNTHICNWIKGVVNETRVSFCLIGLPEFGEVLTSDPQLARRFPRSFLLRPLTLGGGNLQKFLKEIFEKVIFLLNLKKVPDITEETFLLRIYAATGGNPSFIMALIKEAVFVGLRNGGDSVTENDFSIAWSYGIVPSANLTMQNPFEMTSAALAAKFRSIV